MCFVDAQVSTSLVPRLIPLSAHKPASAQLVSKKFLEEIRTQAWAQG